MQLVIVESPTKSKTISQFLGPNYRVLSSYGHIRDLPKSEIGIDIENNFRPKYVIPLKARKNANLLKKEAAKANEVILASVDYNEPILIADEKNIVNQYRVGEFIDKAIDENLNLEKFKVPAFDFKSHKIAFKNIKAVSRHPINEPLIEISLDYGRKLKITASHSVFTKNKNGEIREVAGKDLNIGDKLLVPVKLPIACEAIKEIDLLKEIYFNEDLCQKVFISSPSISQYQKSKVLAPKTGSFYQFQPRLIFSTDLIKNLRSEREKLGLSQKSLSEKIGCSQPQVCDWEQGNANPTLEFGKEYLSVLGYDLQTLSQQEVQVAPSSIQMAIQNAIENQWRDSRKSLTHTFQPLSRFTCEEIEKNFKNDRGIEISRHNHLHKMPRFVSVNSDLMTFLGFFTAEGSYLTQGKYVRFSFGNKKFGGEKENIERIKKISKRIFNLSPSDFGDRTSNSVVLNSTLVSFLMKEFLKIRGTAKTKKIPWIVFNVPQPLQFAFLEGLFLGDGSVGKSNIVFNTISEKLAYGIRLLLLQNGILTSHALAFSKKPNRQPIHQIIISSKKRLAEIKPIWEKHYKAKILSKYLQSKNSQSNTKRNWSLFYDRKNDLGLLRIKSIKKVKSSELFVYDFSVEGENFICGNGGICAHNTDEDREGESIAWHLAQVLQLGKFQRIVFHEITKSAIEEALKNSRGIDINLVDAQQARRVLDRLVGYKLSPFLWKKVARGLSAGRVQSVTVRLVVEREREIQNFIPQEYWSIVATLRKLKAKSEKLKASEFETILIKKDGEVIPKLGIKAKKEADEIVKDLEEAEYRVASVEKKEVKRNPLPPFTTSTLQQTAWQKFHWPAKMTMRIAQQLYETGKITYHRTDSLNLSDLSLFAAKKFIIENYGKEYWPGFLRRYKAKGRVQEAHEAIRPSYPDKTPDSLKLESTQVKLYDLIWRRFIASQMNQAVFDSTKAEIEAKNYGFQANGSILKFDGFLKVYPIKFAETELPPLEINEILKLIKLNPSQHFTQPLPRYSEATLIKTLEENGIGRPSTYAPTLSTIQERNYIEKDETKKFRPTEIGVVVNDLLVAHFPEIVDIKFTAEMEEDLDKIAEGKTNWVPVIRKFYNPFEENLQKKYKEVSKKDITEKPTGKTCPKCGAPLLIRLGKYGRFYACSKFPKCRYTESLEENILGIKCPRCEKGEVVEKRTKRRKIFYGCNQFPKCDFALWDKPTNDKCPKCKSLLVETKRKQVKCSKKECTFVLEK